MSEPPVQGEDASGMELAPGVRVPTAAVRFQYSRSGGPGGQNVNKLNTKVELWVALDALAGLRADALERLRSLAGKRLTREGEIHIIAQTTRTQEGNRDEALARLRELLVRAMHRPRARRKTRPTAASRRRRLESKRRRGQIKSGRGRPAQD